jgi:DNA-binding NarL/FixJ family response regulator
VAGALVDPQRLVAPVRLEQLRLGHAGPGADPWYPLTARELEVARLVAAGGTNREIAAWVAALPAPPDPPER